jgi:hypothetical protein
VPAATKRKPNLALFCFGDQPLTVQRLRSLKPGETFTWYRGHLTFDLDRSLAANGCKPYHELLTRVRQAAMHLEAQGRIKLDQIQRHQDGVVFYDYVATGI